MKFEKKGPGLLLHRSLSFWSGILVIVFITWAWWQSWRATKLMETGPWALTSVGSGLLVNHGHSASTADFLAQYGYSQQMLPRARFALYEGKEFDYLESDYNENPAWSFAQQMMNYHGLPGDWICYIPYSWIMMVAAAPWAGLMVWRWRRMKRSLGVDSA